jgi:hypothetical protein
MLENNGDFEIKYKWLFTHILFTPHNLTLQEPDIKAIQIVIR